MNPFINIIEEHVDEITFLWTLRATAIMQPQHTAQTITKLEQRIEKHLKGLTNVFDDAWYCCEQVIEFEDAGAAFVMAVVAILNADPKKIKIAVEAGMINEQTFKGLVSAFDWIPSTIIESWIKRLLDSDNLEHKYLAIAACSEKRRDPRNYLSKILTDKNCFSHQKLYTKTLRLAGELKRIDLLPIIQQAKNLDDPDVIFWANWSSLLMGDRHAIAEFKPTVIQLGENQQHAIDIVFRVLPINEARQWISELASDPEHIRVTINAISVLGDPFPVNWLISQMQTDSVARLAGEAFTTITGIDLEEYGLVAPASQPNENNAPQESEDFIDDGGNEKVDDDEPNMEDENLAWPDPKKINLFWEQHKTKFNDGQRYFLGQPITTEYLKHVIKNGRQRHRHAAALEFALLQPINPYLNTKSRALQ